MRFKGIWVSLLVLMLISAGCSSYSSKPTTTVLPTSNRSIDVVLHRSDVRFSACDTLSVIQTFGETGQLIDSKEARGTALHCLAIPTLIESGSRVGAAAVVAKGLVNAAKAQRPDEVNISNSQSQGQNQLQTSTNVNAAINDNTNVNINSNVAKGGNGGAGGAGGSGDSCKHHCGSEQGPGDNNQ